MRVAKFAEHTRSPSTLLDELRTEIIKPTFSPFRRSKCAKSSAIIVSSSWSLFLYHEIQVRRCILASPEEYGPMKLEETAWKYTVHGVIQRLKKDYRGSKSEITQLNSTILVFYLCNNIFQVRSFLDASYGWYKSFMFQCKISPSFCFSY